MDKVEAAKDIIAAAIQHGVFDKSANKTLDICSAYKLVYNAIFEAQQEELDELRKNSY